MSLIRVPDGHGGHKLIPEGSSPGVHGAGFAKRVMNHKTKRRKHG